MIEKEKIAEYLLAYSNLVEYASYNKDVKISDVFNALCMKGLISIDKDEYYDMILIYGYLCIIKIFSFYKDVFFKGIDEKDLDNVFFDDEIEENKKTLENFTKKDIILFIRNAFAHSNGENQLYSFEKNDEGEIVIRVSLKKVKASIGENKGNITPFNIVLDFYSFLYFSYLLSHGSRASQIVGVSVKDKKAVEIAKNVKNSDILLKRLLDHAYYHHYFYGLISDKDMTDIEQLSKDNFYIQYMELLEPKKKKIKKRNLTVMQKNTFYTNLMRWKNTNLEFDLNEVFDYESSKIIPLGIIKTDKLYLSLYRALMFLNDVNYDTGILEIIDGLFGKRKNEFNRFKHFFMDRDNLMERVKYGVVDSDNDNNLALSLFMGYMLENVIEDDKVVIENKEYPRHRLRNAFVHGRWYVSDKKWELFDWKKDEFNVEWHKSINISSMRDAMIDYLDSYIKNKKNIR